MKIINTLIACLVAISVAAAASYEKGGAAIQPSTPAAVVPITEFLGKVAHRHLQGGAGDFDFGIDDLDDCAVGAMMECAMDHCVNTCDDTMAGDMGGDTANLDVTDCAAVSSHLCTGFVQAATAMQTCCNACTTETIEYLECSFTQTFALFCPDETAECDVESASAAGNLGGGMLPIMVVAIGSIVSVGILF